MATDGGNPKDPSARRRRIAEKGLDRMALITGRSPIPTVSPPELQSHHAYTSSCPPSIDNVVPSDETTEPDTVTASKDTGSKRERVLRKCETIVRHSASHPTETKTSRTTSPSKPPKPDLLAYLCKTINPDYLRPAIIASQDTRRKCAIVAAVIALLSYVGFPILGNYLIRSTILARPLLLLMLINMAIVVAPLLKDTMQKVNQEAGAGSCSSGGETESADHVGMALAWGMFCQTSLNAFFMDSSIYSVVVVCGVSFLQKVGF